MSMKNVKSTLTVLCVLAVVFTLCACGESVGLEWPDSGMGAMLPEPPTDEGTVNEGVSYFSAYITGVTVSDYLNYVNACKERGFTIEAEEGDSEYMAFNADRYRLELTYYQAMEEYDIWLDAPMYEDGETFTWPSEGLAALLPEPESNIGLIVYDDERNFAVCVGETPAGERNAYIDACIAAGFDVDMDRADNYFLADNPERYHLEVIYEGLDTIYIALNAPSGTAAEQSASSNGSDAGAEEERAEADSDDAETPGDVRNPDSGAEDTGATQDGSAAQAGTAGGITLEQIPSYTGSPYTVINDNVPFFTESDFTTDSYELYSDLDSLGRCGVAMACIGQDLMPTEDRESISSVKPTGWQTAEYDFVDGGYLYNRCHLIAFELAGENANERNLITGTRYFNVTAMLPFENQVADYVKETDLHVLYRVTPMFAGDNLVATGVLMEAESVEDRGEDILFNVFCYNVQPGVGIDYATGDSWADGTIVSTDTSGTESGQTDTFASSAEVSSTYVLNTSSKKFHYATCTYVAKMSDRNREDFNGTREEAISMGYEPCKVCRP